MKSFETVLEFSSLQNTWHPDTTRKAQSIWLPMKSFRNQDTHMFALALMIFVKGS